MNDIEQTSARHQDVIAMYERGSGAAPAFGMIGTLVGLVKMEAGAIGEMQPSQEDRQIAPVAQSSSCTAYTSASLSQRIFPASARFAAARSGMVHGIGKRFF